LFFSLVFDGFGKSKLSAVLEIGCLVEAHEFYRRFPEPGWSTYFLGSDVFRSFLQADFAPLFICRPCALPKRPAKSFAVRTASL
jgi:hypothetical protein